MVLEEESSSSFPTIVIVARHGERLDYAMTAATGDNWTATAKRPWDPPLTQHGFEQARKLGVQIAKECQRLNLAPVSCIYSSPFLRVRQTATCARRGYLTAIQQEEQQENETSQTRLAPARVELGLTESINAAWYRSWCLRGTNGKWNFKPSNPEYLTNVETFHPLARQPIQVILDWRQQSSGEQEENDDVDVSYESHTKIDQPYCFGASPPLIESAGDQMARMKHTIETMHVKGQTVVMVSHGGPVTHLFEALTAKNWKEHGSSSYCCYTIYQRNDDDNDGGGLWNTLAVNESSYLEEEIISEVHV